MLIIWRIRARPQWTTFLVLLTISPWARDNNRKELLTKHRLPDWKVIDDVGISEQDIIFFDPLCSRFDYCWSMITRQDRLEWRMWRSTGYWHQFPFINLRKLFAFPIVKSYVYKVHHNEASSLRATQKDDVGTLIYSANKLRPIA